MPITLLLHGRHGPGVTYAPLGTWLVPWRFSPDGFHGEYRALREGAGLVDYSTQAVIECRGEDRVDFLQRLLTSDLFRLKPGEGCRAALLSPNAKLIAEMLVLADAGAHWLLCDLPQAEALSAALERYRFSERLELIFHERRLAVLALEGPRAVELAAALSGTAAPVRAGDHLMTRLAGIPVRLIARTLTGAGGVSCLFDGESLEMVWDALGQQGHSWGLRPAGWDALNTARLEAGEPWFGLDMDDTVLLPETGLDTALASDSKGCYIGQEIVARMQTYGSASKRLMGLVLEGDAAAEPGARIVLGAEEAGWITSSCRSPALGRPIALGYLKRGAYEPGTRVEVLRGDRRILATVVALPFPRSVRSR